MKAKSKKATKPSKPSVKVADLKPTKDAIGGVRKAGGEQDKERLTLVINRLQLPSINTVGNSAAT